jgi:hypothetical protein
LAPILLLFQAAWGHLMGNIGVSWMQSFATGWSMGSYHYNITYHIWGDERPWIPAMPSSSCHNQPRPGWHTIGLLLRSILFWCPNEGFMWRTVGNIQTCPNQLRIYTHSLLMSANRRPNRLHLVKSTTGPRKCNH